VGRGFGFIGLVIVLAVGMWIYTHAAKSVMPEGSGKVTGLVDTVGVQNDLLAIANAERSQFALNGHYLSLDELRANGEYNLPASGRAGYTYSVDTTSDGFRAVASYSGAPGTAPQTISIDQMMEIRTE